MQQIALPGFFGKLPCNGDFVSRRLPRDPFLNIWDEWLQNCIATSKEQLQEEWLSLYLTSPIWRFALSPGICGPGIWSGVLMPSVDKVGRYYPLTIATSLDNSIHPIQLIDGIGDWYQNAEDVALSGLEDDLDLENFDCSVVALGSPITSTNLDNLHIELEHAVPVQLNISSANKIADIFPLLSKILIDSTFSNFSIWWTNGSDHVKPRLIFCPDLPIAESYAAFLDGNWEQWGWPNQINNILPLEPDNIE